MSLTLATPGGSVFVTAIGNYSKICMKPGDEKIPRSTWMQDTKKNK